MKLLVAAMLAMSAMGPAHAQAIPSDSAILAIIKTRVDSGRAPGIVVGIYEHGQRRYVSYGSAGPGRAPLDQHTFFEIGSISKTFTALLLADAATRGEVRLDQPVADLLPPGTTVPQKDGKPITLELLSTHRSGLPRVPGNMVPANIADPYVDYDTKRLYAFLASYTLPRAPGDSAEYSNLGAGLLGHALTLRSGMPTWGALVARRITGPLGMRETVVDVPSSMLARLAAGHDEKLDTVPAWHLDALAGAGALRSTAADMLTYLAAELDTSNGPLKKAIALGRPPRATFAPGLRIALGWLIGGTAEHPIWWHNGGTGGFRSFVAFDPNRQVAVVVLANSALSPDDIGLHIMNPLLPIVMPVVPPRTRVTVVAEDLDRLVGEYAMTPAMTLTISRVGAVLYGQATGQGRFPLSAASPTRFVFPAAGIDIDFHLDTAGRAREMVFRQGGGVLTIQRRP
ncbi:MAG: ampH [Gemmatimonadetes bacterium]|nr:ampH [Gemmatimonadota bacterium]